MSAARFAWGVFVFTCCAGAPVLAADAPERPYEMVRAGRTADEFPPLVKLEDATGWSVETVQTEAFVTTATDRALFGGGVLRLSYRAPNGTNAMPVVRIKPPSPVPVPTDADTVSLWVYGNNICGREGYGGGRVVPVTRLSADFRTATGEPFSVDLGGVRHREWFLQIAVADAATRAKFAQGASFVSFSLTNGTNAAFEQLDFTSFNVFRDPQRPLGLAARPPLPIPVTPRTIVPGNGSRSENFEFRLPAKPSESWDDLAVRVKGGDWMPLAVGGGVYPLSARKQVNVTFSRDGDSVVAEIDAPADSAEEVRFGAAQMPVAFERVGLPYYTYAEIGAAFYRPKAVIARVGGEPFFFMAHMDWTASNASEPIMRDMAAPSLAESNAGTAYVPKTDGRRNAVRERFVWSVGRDLDAVMPVIPNPPSPWKKATGTVAWRPHGAGSAGGTREADRVFWRRVKRRGITKLTVCDHEVQWRDGNESFTFRTETAPGKGGDSNQLAHVRFMHDEMGFRYGPYNNFTDFAPVNANWSIDHVARWKDGSLAHAWNRCYAPKPTWSAWMNAKLAPAIQKKFRFNTAYCDVHTCIAPWGRTDYDHRAPGGGTFGATFRSYADILLTQRAAWGGPVYSEGCIHFLYAGITDGNYAQDSHYGLSVNPWIVDFDLRRIHPLNCNFGMGSPDMFYCWWRTQDDTDPKTSAEVRLDRFLAATLAFGHAPFLCGGTDFTDGGAAMMRSYFTVLGVASRYTQADVREIRYGGADGALFTTEAALLNGACGRSQVRVVYADGTTVAANGSRTENFKVEVAGVVRVLPPNGWCAVSGDGAADSFSGEWNGTPIEYARGDGYFFVNGRGKKKNAFGGGSPYGATDGMLVRLARGEGVEEVVVAQATGVRLPYVAKRVTGLDEAGKATGPVAFETNNGVTTFRTRPGDVSYEVAR